ncbi:3-deoxy-manno-octulosonate cytidylyltransferase, partial [Haemophilus influenzae]
GGGELPKAEGG